MKRVHLAAGVMLLVFMLIFAGFVYASQPTPGSVQDPVVTKSYVDNLFNTLSQAPSESVASSFVVVEVAGGKKLIGGEGTEMILRGGKAEAIDNGADGISDLTSGRDLKSGQKVEFNHHLLVPRADGRGISCTAKSWVMVKGSYTIE